MSFGAAIKKLRKNAGLSQQEVAAKLGMARATYASLEVDRREPDLGELKAISEFYEISLIELVAEEGDDWPGVIREPEPVYKKHEDHVFPVQGHETRFNPAKLQQVLLYVTAQIGAKPHVGESVLYKLLYCIDYDYHEHCGQTITGLTYLHNQYGPAPTRSYSDAVRQMESNGEIEIVSTKHFNNTQRKYLPVVAADMQYLSAGELQHIDRTLGWFGDMSPEEINMLSRSRAAWLVAEPKEASRVVA